MDIFSLSSTAHYSQPPHFSAAILPGKTLTTAPILSFNLPPDSPHNSRSIASSSSTRPRRPSINNPPTTSNHKGSKFPKNPLKNLINSTPPPPTIPSPSPQSLTSKLWLSSKLNPPPPPPPPQPSVIEEGENDVLENSESSGPGDMEPRVEIREQGKIFVGNLPLWIKKNEVAEFFRQFGPIKNVILIKGHHETDRNMGFGFVIYGGPMAEKAALKAVEFDGIEFHGRVLTVKLDDGRRLKAKREERKRWVEGKDEDEYRSKWHEEREGSRREFRKVLESHPDNWQAVVQAFERIKKPSRKEFGLMVNYYARRGDMHRARETFEKMRARGIEPTSHVYTNLVHAYAVGRDMEEALSCVRKMKDEGLEMSLVTYSIIVSGFAKLGNVDQTGNMDRAEELVREMEEDGIDAPIDIYHTMMDGYTMSGNAEKCLIVFDRLKKFGRSSSLRDWKNLQRPLPLDSMSSLFLFEPLKPMLVSFICRLLDFALLLSSSSFASDSL
nr:pentatricopeptide repeat-containing protein At5g04810, chloroplastic [Ipomoea batatas]